LLTLYGLGTILGAGIYVLVGTVAARAGLYAPVAFVVAASLAALTALSYGELGARYPKSAGEAIFVQEGFRRPRLSTVIGILIAVTGIVSAATIAVGFTGYLRVFIAVPHWLSVAVLLISLGAIACWGIKQSVMAAAIMTLIEVAGLLLVLVVGGDSLGELPARIDELLPPLDAAVWTGILLGAFVAFYAFIGFEDMVNVAEEVVEPSRNLPRAIVIALIVSSVLYIAVATVCVLGLGPTALADSTAPMADIYRQATGREPVLITAISMIAVINGALVQIIMASRVLYGLAKEGWLPARLGVVNARTHTPVLSTVLVSGTILLLAATLPLDALAQTTSFVILTIFAIVNLSLWRIKRRERDSPRPDSIGMWVPMVGFVATVALLLFRAFHLLG
jgi:amino acid transporter